MRVISDLDELKSIEYSILEKVVGYCEKEGIGYFLAYGTLLGAVRHQGFIPWDDDVDVWMKRPDYERFLAVFPAVANSLGLGINSREITDNYNRVFTQVYDIRTTLRETGRDNRFEEGVFIDISPVDLVPDNPLVRWVHLTRLQFIKLRLLSLSLKKRPKGAAEGSVRYLVRRLLAYGNPEKLVYRYDLLASSYGDRDLSYCMFQGSGHLGRTYVARSEWFDGVVKKRFEQDMFLCPAGFHNLLTLFYGDYMQLPPKESREPHHEFVAYWLE